MGSLTVDRRIPAPPERVWRAFADPALLSAWFWPPSFATAASLDARPGGALRIHSEENGMGVTGVVSAAEEGRMLATTWRWDGEDEETTVTIKLVPDGDGTRLTVRHDGFAHERAVAEHVLGWNDCLDRLVAAA